MMRRSNFLKSSSKKSKDIGIGSLALGLLFSGILLYFGFWIFGRWQANQAIQDKTDVKERIELEFKVQSHLLEVVKAFGNLTFAVTAYYAWRNLKVAEENRELAENRQVTERFSKAVEMLGSEESDELKIGGIYLLERIARDFPQDYWTVVEVLTAFVRRRSPIEKKRAQSKIGSDIQTALTSISNLIPLRQP